MIGSRVGFRLHVRRHATTLDHEVADDAMENGAVIKTVIGVLQKVLNDMGASFGYSSSRMSP